MIGRIAARVGEERGFTLMEVTMAMALLVVILGATLTTFNQFEGTSRLNQIQNEAQDRTRLAIDRLARELRNLASPTPQQPLAVDKAQAYDLVFQTVDPVGPNTGQNAANVRRVRFCLDTSNANNEKIWSQQQRWTTAAAPTVPATASCPDSSWGNQTLIANNIVNRASGQDRAVWAFNSTTLTDITSVRTTIYVDVNPGAKPAESRLGTGVFLRNQNRRPIASFTATVAGSRHVILNGSASEDPEGDALTYTWYDGTTKIGTGTLLDYPAPAAPASTTRSIKLQVFDTAGLVGELGPLSVNVP